MIEATLGQYLGRPWAPEPPRQLTSFEMASLACMAMKDAKKISRGPVSLGLCGYYRETVWLEPDTRDFPKLHRNRVLL